jgi:hypothetical protein
MNRDFRAELAKQLRFLEASCAEFDRGNEDEGVRIATALAIIFHNSGSSKSLLAHLNATRIQLLSTSSQLTHAIIGNLTTLNIDVATAEARFHPKRDSGLRKYLRFGIWWDHEMIFLKESQKICRRHLVLAARNKDGGAHVDAYLDPDYEWLVDGAGWGMTHSRGDIVIQEWTFRSAHLASIRQIGHEVLNTPSIEFLL